MTIGGITGDKIVQSVTTENFMYHRRAAKRLATQCTIHSSTHRSLTPYKAHPADPNNAVLCRPWRTELEKGGPARHLYTSDEIVNWGFSN